MLLRETLQKRHKNLEDAQFIYGSIRKFRFFENFFAQNLKTMDFDTILSFCKKFEYESIPIGDFVFNKGDPSNNKFYIIISGQVSIVIPRKEEDVQNAPKSPQNKKPGRRVDMKTVTLVTQAISAAQGAPKHLTVIKEAANKEKGGPLGNFRASHSSGTRFFSTPNREKNEDEEKNNEGNPPPRAYERFATVLKSHEKISDGNPPARAHERFSTVLKNQSEKKIEEEEDFLDQPCGLDYVECPPELGTVVRKMNEGESFGELALKNNAPRSASVYCNSECEFLIITKQQFDLIFLKKELEKEAFLKASFPYLGTVVSSSTSFNYLLYSFKTEAYNKGAYLMREGRISKKQPKLFIIHQGECLIEKSLTIEVDNPYDRAKPMVYNAQPLNLAVVGKGTLIGEEILITKNQYNYSVKAVSETVIVHTVTKKDFDSKFFKEFNEYLIDIYEKKKKQRDMIYESLKKEQEMKFLQNKEANIYFMKNTQMKNVMNKSAINGFSRYIYREQKNVDTKASFTDLRKSPEFSDQDPQSYQSLATPKLDSQTILKKYLAENQPPIRQMPKMQRQSTLDTDEIKKLSPTLTSDFITMAPNGSRATAVESKDIGSLRFFDEEPKKFKPVKNVQCKSPDTSVSYLSAAKSQRTGSAQIDVLLKGIASRARKDKRLKVKLVDVKGNQSAAEGNDSQTFEQEPHNSMYLHNEVTISSQSTLSPIKVKEDDNIFFPRSRKEKKSNSTMSWFGQKLSLKTENLPDKEWNIFSEKTSPATVAEKRGGFRSANTSLPKIKHLNLEIEETEESGESKQEPNAKSIMMLSAQQSLINLEADSRRQSGKLANLSLNDSIETGKSVSNSALLNTKVQSVKHSRQRSHLLVAADIRKSLFSKTPIRESSPKMPIGKFVLSSRAMSSVGSRK